MSVWIGLPVRRQEDATLLTGCGCYTTDQVLPGQLHAVMLRSPHAHAAILSIDAGEARAIPGVAGIFVGADLEASGFGPFRCGADWPGRNGTTMLQSWRPTLAMDRVHSLGDCVAMVVAESLATARDAAEAIAVDYEALPAVSDMDAATAPDAPLVHKHIPGNIALDFHFGDTVAVDAAFAKAAHVARLDLISNRLVVNPMEARAALGHYDAASDEWLLWVGSQGVHGVRDTLAKEVLRIPPGKLRVRSGHVGGGFGTKIRAYPEYAAVLFAARALGRPVKWVNTRSDSFISDNHGRDHRMHAELALDATGRFLAVRLDGQANAGAWPVPPNQITANTVKNIASVYATPLIEVSAKVILTHTATTAAYRGAGRPEANYYMERLIEVAAQELGISAVTLRRRNHVGPMRLPYRAPSGLTYDSGDFPSVLDRALAVADWEGFATRAAASAARGLLRGRGLGQFLEVTAGDGQEGGAIVFTADGMVELLTGTLDSGQGHATTFGQVVAERLGLPPERLRLRQGDTGALAVGGGSYGSRSLTASGAALAAACTQVTEAARKVAAVHFGAAVAEVTFQDGLLGVGNRSIHLLDLAALLRDGGIVPANDMPTTLDVTLTVTAPPSTFPNGCHVAEVEVDPETGVLRLDRYCAVDDIGTVLNPLVAEGQMHGGIVQGIGQALLECTVYDTEGQLLTGSFMDYALPRASDLPSFTSEFVEVAATTNPLGAKGCGEAGVAGALPAVVNAALDALAPLGIHHLDMPLTPARLWQAIHDARLAG